MHPLQYALGTPVLIGELNVSPSLIREQIVF